MESIAEGKGNVTYKIWRSLNIINGNTKDESLTIYENIKHIYEFRSRIVHVEQYNELDFDSYLPYLRQLIACTIIELLVHGIDKRTELDEKITAIGFGEKKELSATYDPLLPNNFCRMKMIKLNKPYSASRFNTRLVSII